MNRLVTTFVWFVGVNGSPKSISTVKLPSAIDCVICCVGLAEKDEMMGMMLAPKELSMPPLPSVFTEDGLAPGLELAARGLRSR